MLELSEEDELLNLELSEELSDEELLLLDEELLLLDEELLLLELLLLELRLLELLLLELRLLNLELSEELKLLLEEVQLSQAPHTVV